nr:SpaA isopeptide-forming pilin-related protein [uncultured Butyrivibrio sp.]
MKSFRWGKALAGALIIAAFFFMVNSITVVASAPDADSEGIIVTDLSNSEFGEVSDIVLPDTITDQNTVFTMGFGFHVYDADSFPDGHFTYTLPDSLDFSDIYDSQIKVMQDDTELGYAVISSGNVITFHLDPSNFTDNPNGIYGSVAILCKIGDNADVEGGEATISFSDELTCKVKIVPEEEPENPATDPEPQPDPAEDPSTPSVDYSSFNAEISKSHIVDDGGNFRNNSTGEVNWKSPFTISGDADTYSFTISDSIVTGNNTSWINSQKVAANIVTDSLKLYPADSEGNMTGEALDNMSVTYNGSSFLANVKDLSTGSYVLTYTTMDYYGNVNIHTFPAGSSITFKNKISIGVPGKDFSAEDSYEISYEGLPMNKALQAGRYDSESGCYILPWKIHMNRNAFGQSLSTLSEGDSAKVTDYLPAYLTYKEGSAYIQGNSGSVFYLEPGISTEDSKQTLEWNFSWGSDKYYVVCFETYVNKDYFESAVSSGKGTTYFNVKNSAEGYVSGHAGEASANQNVNLKFLEKTASFNSETQQINYTVTVNAQAVDLIDGDEINLTDELENGSFNQSSLKVYNLNTNEEYSLSADKKNFTNKSTKMTIIIPDQKALVIKYSVNPDKKSGSDIGNGKVQVDVNNKVTLSASTARSAGVSGSYKMNKVSANVTSKSGSLSVTKVKKDNHDNKLEGSEIALYKVNLNDGSVSLVGQKTTTNPFCCVTFNEDGTYKSLVFDTLYYYQELKAPAGYTIDNTKHFFVLASSRYSTLKTKVADYVNSVANSDLTVLDTKTEGTELEVNLENEIDNTPAPESGNTNSETENGNNSNDPNASNENNESDNTNNNTDEASSSSENGSADTSDNSANAAANSAAVAGANRNRTLTTSTASAANAQNIKQLPNTENPDLPEVLGTYSGDKKTSGNTSSSRTSSTGDTNKAPLRVLVILAAAVLLFFLTTSELHHRRK